MDNFSTVLLSKLRVCYRIIWSKPFTNASFLFSKHLFFFIFLHVCTYASLLILWSFSDPSCHFSSFEKLVLVFLQDVNSFRIAIHSSILHLTISEDEFILLHFPRTFNLSLWARTLYNGLSSASQEDWWVFQIFNFETSPTYFIKYLDYNITEFLSRDYFFF